MDQEKYLQAPGYPSASGQSMPDLNLASGPSTPMTSLDTNKSHLADSTPPQRLDTPALRGSAQEIHDMGQDKDVQLLYQPNLAGQEIDVPAAARIAKAAPGGDVILPTFISPSTAVPSTQPYDLTGPGMRLIAPFEPDPHASDLLDFCMPAGLDMYVSTEVPMMADPSVPDLTAYDQPDGLGMPGPLMVDPALPDLQNPQYSQEVEMDERPGDLDEDAMSIMHASATYQQLPTSNYNSLYMEQHGNNSHRSRHMGMLDLGLDKEER